MVIDRRAFLRAAAGAGTWLAASTPIKASPSASSPLYAATRKTQSGRYEAVLFRTDGTDVTSVTLPARGHDLAVSRQTKHVVAFARRPGNFAVAFASDTSRPRIAFTSPPNRHFYGHGTFSQDGRLLYATENDFDAARGCIGIYDATDRYRRIGEFDSHGVGPHDVALLPDGQTLLVANGGIETHPDIGSGRTKLNLATMEPSLAYIDANTGDLIERHELPSATNRLSLRHLDVGERRTVIIGGQIQRGGNLETPLIYRHRLGDAPSPVDLPRGVASKLRGYVSSVAVDDRGEVAALTSSRGGAVVFVNIGNGDVIDVRRLRDVSGVASAPGRGFLLTTGTGIVDTQSTRANRAVNWDNHATRVE